MTTSDRIMAMVATTVIFAFGIFFGISYAGMERQVERCAEALYTVNEALEYAVSSMRSLDSAIHEVLPAGQDR